MVYEENLLLCPLYSPAGKYQSIDYHQKYNQAFILTLFLGRTSGLSGFSKSFLNSGSSVFRLAGMN